MKSLLVIFLCIFIQAAFSNPGDECEDGYDGCDMCESWEADEDSCLVSCYCNEGETRHECVKQMPSQQWTSGGVKQMPSQQRTSGGNAGAVAAGVVGAAAAGAAVAGAAHHNKRRDPLPPPPPAPPAQTPAPQSQIPTCNWCMRDKCSPGACKAVKNFNANEDAKKIRNAVKGLGTDEDVLIDILIHRSEEQIEMIRQAYIGLGFVLDEHIKDETSSKIKKLFQALLKDRKAFYAEQLENAFKGRDKNTIVMILTSLPTCAIREISSYYNKINKKNIFDSAEGAAMFKMEDFLIELVKANRDPEDSVNEEQAKKDAESLKESGSSFMLFANGDVFVDIFTKRSYAHIRKIKEQYEKMGYGNFNKDMKEKSGDPYLREGLEIMLRNIEDQPKYLADVLHDAIGGSLNPLFSDKELLVLMLRGRCGLDLGDVTAAYSRTYKNKNLISQLKHKSVLDYEKALVAMVTEQKD